MYSKEFIAKVKEVYSDSPTIIVLAEKGSDMHDSSNFCLSPRIVLDSTYEELVILAEKALRKQELYHIYTMGACYDSKELEHKMCPILYMQNNCDTNKMYMEEKICQGVGYVSYFPSCQKWGCKGECWKKYYMLKDGVE